MSNLKRDLNNFISYLQKINLKEEENLENFIKDKLNEFLIIKKENLEIQSKCQFCKECFTCKIYGFPCINCANICYKMKLGEGYPLHIN
jgi:hypothetical protein